MEEALQGKHQFTLLCGATPAVGEGFTASSVKTSSKIMPIRERLFHLDVGLEPLSLLSTVRCLVLNHEIPAYRIYAMSMGNAPCDCGGGKHRQARQSQPRRSQRAEEQCRSVGFDVVGRKRAS